MQRDLIQIRKPWYRRASMGIALDVVIAVGGVTLARLLGSLTQVVLARRMGLTDFGVYTTFFTLLGPVIMVSSMGLDTWLLREGGRRTDLDDTIGQVFSLRLLFTGVLMLLAVPVLAATGRTSLSLPVVFAALGLTAELLLTTGNTALRAQVRNVAASLLQVLVAALTIGLIFLLWSPELPLLTATGFRLLADTVGLAVMVWLLGRSLRHIGFRPARLWGMVYAARHFFATDVLSNIALKADLILVALVLGSSAAGIYSPALLIVNTTFVVPMVAWQVLLPLVSRMEPRSSQFRRTLGFAVAGSVAYGIFWLLVLTWGAAPLIDAIFRPRIPRCYPAAADHGADPAAEKPELLLGHADGRARPAGAAKPAAGDRRGVQRGGQYCRHPGLRPRRRRLGQSGDRNGAAGAYGYGAWRSLRDA